MARIITYKVNKPVSQSEITYVKVNSKDMALFRFLIEAYDNLAMLTVIEPKTTLIKIQYSLDERSRFYNALKSIQDCIFVEILINPFL